jgi:hypothetical protein
MKKSIILTVVFAFAMVTAGRAQFGVQQSIRNHVRHEARRQAKETAKEEGQKVRTETEDKAMEEADKNLDKAAEAAEPGLEKAEEAEEQAEEATIYGIQKYGEFVAGYEADVESKDPADYKKYRFNSAMVKYDMKGHEEGTKTLYIDMGGYKLAEYKKLRHKKETEKETTIMIGADMIAIDYENKEVTKVHNPMAYLLANPDRDWEETAENILTHMGFRKTGQETILDRNCDVWQHGRMKIWVWDGLTLKSVNGKDVETAIDVQIDTDIPKEVFEAPEGFEYIEVGASDMFPELSEEEAKQAFEEDEEDMDEILDEIENMTYSEYKAKVLEEEPGANEMEIKQSYLYLRQEAKRRHRDGN